jgi:glutamate/tyrosine decarboxylase-like PLP-dependent enzyme
LVTIAKLTEEIEVLRAAMRPLEPDEAERAVLGQQALDHALAYLRGVPEGPSYHPIEQVFARGLDPEIPETGRDPTEVLTYLAECVDTPGLAPTSPRFMGYIPGGALFHSALGDMLAAVSNRYAGFAWASPGAVRMENVVTRWLADAVGYPLEAAGTLTSGGSIANLTAIVTARDASDPQGGGAVYLTRFAHHCIDKALHIAGRGQAPRREIATDARHRMDLAALAEALEADRAAGIRPWLVVASAGTVDTGSVDPLPEIAALAREHGAWLHIDGAYGGLFALCEEGRKRVRGIELADSLALDPHKTLFLPYGTGAVLVRDGRNLAAAFSASADYIEPLDETGVGPSPADLSIELTRHFRALRLWLPLQIAGVEAFRSAQREKLLLARYFHTRLGEIPGIEAGPEPDLSVVAFRYLPASGDADAFNEALLRRIVEEGRVMFSGTRINGQQVLRCAILSFRTHLEHVDEAIAAIERNIAAMQSLR